MKKFIIAICFFVITGIASVNAAEVVIKKGEQFELCRELKQILQEPVNDDFGKGKICPSPQI